MYEKCTGMFCVNNQDFNCKWYIYYGLQDNIYTILILGSSDIGWDLLKIIQIDF